MNAEHELRFLAKFLIGDECWTWQAAAMANGYGSFSVRRKTKYAHRVSYELFVGPIPDGLEIDHLCRNRLCVNPSHMEAVTHRENLLRGTSPSARNFRATHCPAGHPYDAANTCVRKRGRDCRACNRERQRRLRSQAKATE